MLTNIFYFFFDVANYITICDDRSYKGKRLTNIYSVLTKRAKKERGFKMPSLVEQIGICSASICLYNMYI